VQVLSALTDYVRVFFDYLRVSEYQVVRGKTNFAFPQHPQLRLSNMRLEYCCKGLMAVELNRIRTLSQCLLFLSLDN
jgi:hypothetical protein